MQLKIILHAHARIHTFHKGRGQIYPPCFCPQYSNSPQIFVKLVNVIMFFVNKSRAPEYSS